MKSVFYGIKKEHNRKNDKNDKNNSIVWRESVINCTLNSSKLYCAKFLKWSQFLNQYIATYKRKI